MMRTVPRLTRRVAASIVVGLSIASAASVAVLLDEPSSSAVHQPGSWAVQGPLMVANLTVRHCPTHLGAPRSGRVTLPTFVRADVSRRLASGVAVFTDALGTLDVVAPSGWQCTALDGLAGLSTLLVFPPGQARPAWGDIATVHRGIVASQTGGCLGCSLETACSLFPAARHRYVAAYGVACPRAGARGELVARVSPWRTRFIDPPSVSGTGRPSGGADTAYGAMVWHPRHGVRNATAWLVTCTLPQEDQQLCVLSADAFLARHHG
jgi:hypothetical protein